MARIGGHSRDQSWLLPGSVADDLTDYILVRFIDALVDGERQISSSPMRAMVAHDKVILACDAQAHGRRPGAPLACEPQCCAARWRRTPGAATPVSYSCLRPGAAS